jgi:hypothetical protein
MKKSNMVESNNAFVKREQAKMAAKMGDRPGAPADMKHFDAFMSNDGENAQVFGRKLCKGLDDAFPLK